MLHQLDKNTLKYIIETSPIGLFLTDKTNAVTWFNPTLAHLIGDQQETFMGKTEQTVAEEFKSLFSEQGIVHIHADREPSKYFICTKQPLENELYIHFVHDASSMQQLFQERDELKNIIDEMKSIDTF
jgi:c-di-AMP phosphodiesterase-like protein